PVTTGPWAPNSPAAVVVAPWWPCVRKKVARALQMPCVMPVIRLWRYRLAEQAAIDETVSFESEPLILVDSEDRDLGHRSKTESRDGNGILHRAFSLFIFNPAGELLLQQRSAQKRLWPLDRSNRCCSLPRSGE